MTTFRNFGVGVTQNRGILIGIESKLIRKFSFSTVKLRGLSQAAWVRMVVKVRKAKREGWWWCMVWWYGTTTTDIARWSS